MAESHNPYAPPKAAVLVDPVAATPVAEEREVGGFWRRVGASIIDSVILSPMVIVQFVLLTVSLKAYVYFILPTDVIALVYYVYLVKRFGGTPGKRILGMRIEMADGSPVTTRAAFLRFSPVLVSSVLSSIASIVTVSNLDPSFTSEGFLTQMRLMGTAAPGWSNVVTWITQAFWLATVITMLSNQRRRAIHDFIAGTAVVRD